VVVALAGALAATVATAAIPLVQRQIIDNVIVTHRASIWPLAGLLIVAAAVNFYGIYLRRYRGGRLSLDVQHELRTGRLVGRAISDLNMVQGLLSMVPVTLGNIVLFVLTIGIMVVLSPVLTIVTVAVAPALWVIALASRRKLFPASWDAQQQSGEVAGVVDEAIGGVRVVKGFGQEEQEQERLETASTRLFASRLRMIRLTARYNPALTAIPSLGVVGVLALGGWLAIHGSITLGTFLAFSAYLAQMAGPVRMLTYMVTLGQEARASVIRVFDIIDSRPVIADRPDAIGAFLKAWFETVAYMRQHKAETVQIAKDVMESDPDVAARVYDALMPMFSDDGKFDAKALAVLRKSYVELKILDAEPDMKAFYTEAFLPKK